MPTHYIYEEPDQKCLCQGDVLNRTDEITDLLGKSLPCQADHPVKLKYFLVLTQTCDLVRRNGLPPSAQYITIAAVLPVEEAILLKAKKHQQWWQTATKVVDSRTLNELTLFTESLFDNNIAHYFYLYEDISTGISGRGCAFLAYAVALGVEHYDILLKGKVAQMKDEFRAKLGWLVGDMYSRVGTKEWDEHYGKGDARKRASLLLRDVLINIDKQKIDKGIKELKNKKSLTKYAPAEIFNYIKDTKIISRKATFSRRIGEMSEDFKLIDPICSRLIQEINKNKEFVLGLKLILDKWKKNANEIDSLTREILSLLEETLGTVLTDATFPGRKRVVDLLVTMLKQDSVINSILD